jgi:hypothetical protein
MRKFFPILTIDGGSNVSNAIVASDEIAWSHAARGRQCDQKCWHRSGFSPVFNRLQFN